MQTIRALLWLLAGMTGLAWAFTLLAEVSLAIGNPGLAIWTLQITSGPAAGVSLSVLFVIMIAVFSRLSPRLYDLHRLRTVLRGTPRLLRQALGLTVACLAIRVVWQLSTGALNGQSAQPQSLALLICFFAFTCALTVSGARIGLGEPVCENGHVLAPDMTHCSLCDAPAKGVAP